MPDIVRACYASLRQHGGDRKVILLTEENYRDYLNIPDFMVSKYEKGHISPTHFSDILRTLALIQYGGIWADATVLFTQDIPDIISAADFFIFRPSLTDPGFLPGSNWFIVAKPHSLILRKVLKVLFRYWKDRRYITNYFIYHSILRLVLLHNADAKKIIETMPYQCNAEPHLLQSKLFDTADPGMWAYISNLSFAHKLTYKSDPSMARKENTYYKYIVGNRK